MQDDIQLKVFLIGKNGRTTQETVKRGLQKGYSITAYMPDAQNLNDTVMARLNEIPPNLDIVQGTFDTEHLATSMRMHQVVICVFDPDFPIGNNPKQLMEAIFDAMQQNEISRLICTSAERHDAKFGCLGRLLKRCAMKQFFERMDSLENCIEATPTSQIQWTIVHSHELTNQPYSGLCQLWTRDSVPKGSLTTNFQTPRSDLADFLLEQISDYRYVGKAVQIALPEDNSGSLFFTYSRVK